MTGPRSRAELQLDFANVLRLDENASASVATLQGNSIQIQLSQGVAEYSVLEGTEAGVEIDTPNVAVNPRRVGLYRIEVTPSGDTLVTIHEGEADISTPEGSTQLQKGQTANVRGTGNDVRYQIVAASGYDDFDRFSSSRDQQVATSESDRYANQYYTGASDLDAYGTWDNVPDYGWVWAPRVVVGWVPYRHGRWVWEPYWAGHGFPTNPGAGRRITMDAGSCTARPGSGGQGRLRSAIVRRTPQHMSRFSDLARAADCGSALPPAALVLSAGCRRVRAIL